MAITPEKRARIYERNGFACVGCGAQPGVELLTLDHIWPRAYGGTDRDDNLQTLCRPCNQAKADRIPDDPAAAKRARKLLRRKKLARIASLSPGPTCHSRDCHPRWGCVTGCPVQAQGMLEGWTA